PGLHRDRRERAERPGARGEPDTQRRPEQPSRAVVAHLVSGRWGERGVGDLVGEQAGLEVGVAVERAGEDEPLVAARLNDPLTPAGGHQRTGSVAHRPLLPVPKTLGYLRTISSHSSSYRNLMTSHPSSMSRSSASMSRSLTWGASWCGPSTKIAMFPPLVR